MRAPPPPSCVGHHVFFLPIIPLLQALTQANKGMAYDLPCAVHMPHTVVAAAKCRRQNALRTCEQADISDPAVALLFS